MRASLPSKSSEELDPLSLWSLPDSEEELDELPKRIPKSPPPLPEELPLDPDDELDEENERERLRDLPRPGSVDRLVPEGPDPVLSVLGAEDPASLLPPLEDEDESSSMPGRFPSVFVSATFYRYASFSSFACRHCHRRASHLSDFSILVSSFPEPSPAQNAEERFPDRHRKLQHCPFRTKSETMGVPPSRL